MYYQSLLERILWSDSSFHPETLIRAVNRRGAESLHSLTAVSNNAGAAGKGGLSILTQANQVDRLVLSFLGNNKALEKKYLTGNIAIELCPQGTLAERLRAAGAGIPAFYASTGARESIRAIVIDIRETMLTSVWFWCRYSSPGWTDSRSPRRIRKSAGTRQTSGDQSFQRQNVFNGICT